MTFFPGVACHIASPSCCVEVQPLAPPPHSPAAAAQLSCASHLASAQPWCLATRTQNGSLQAAEGDAMAQKGGAVVPEGDLFKVRRPSAPPAPRRPTLLPAAAASWRQLAASACMQDRQQHQPASPPALQVVYPHSGDGKVYEVSLLRSAAEASLVLDALAGECSQPAPARVAPPLLLAARRPRLQCTSVWRASYLPSLELELSLGTVAHAVKEALDAGQEEELASLPLRSPAGKPRCVTAGPVPVPASGLLAAKRFRRGSAPGCSESWSGTTARTPVLCSDTFERAPPC